MEGGEDGLAIGGDQFLLPRLLKVVAGVNGAAVEDRGLQDLDAPMLKAKPAGLNRLESCDTPP